MRCPLRLSASAFATLVLSLVVVASCGDGEKGLCDGVICDDGNACTDDICDPADGSCYNITGVECNDDNACTADECDPSDGSCHYTTVVICDDQNECTADECDPSDGSCRYTEVVDCDDDNDCTVDECNPSDGMCEYEVLPDDEPCQTGSSEGLCQGGECVATATIDIEPTDDGYIAQDGVVTTDRFIVVETYLDTANRGVLEFGLSRVHDPIERAALSVSLWGSPVDDAVEVYGYESVDGLITPSDFDAGELLGTLQLPPGSAGGDEVFFDVTAFVASVTTPYAGFNLRAESRVILNSVEVNRGPPPRLTVTSFATLCSGVDCDDRKPCTVDSCNPTSGACENVPLSDGTACAGGFATCQQGFCVGELPCTEEGLQAAAEHGGGPFTFACTGPTTVTTSEEIVTVHDLILDGEGELTIDGNGDHRVLSIRRAQAVVELRGISISGGNATESPPWNDGGGIYNEGTLTFVDGGFLDNSADGSGGAIHNAGTLTLSNSGMSGNHANSGIGVSNSGTASLANVTVLGDGTTRGSGIANGDDATLVVADSVVTHCVGGGITNGGMMTLTNSTVADNIGGGIGNGGTAIVTDSAVSGNTTSSDGGGINNGGLLTLDSSTVSGNSSDRNGGGIYSHYGTNILTNSTISGNSAREWGGGIFNNGDAALTNTTVSGNSADLVGAAIWSGTRSLVLKDTLVEGDCYYHLDSSSTSEGGNIESPADTCRLDHITDQSDVPYEAVRLSPLRDNGGPTLTHAPLPPSIAIDSIGTSVCNLDIDQRGVSRPQGSGCDVGAVEVVPGPFCDGVDCDDRNACTDDSCDPGSGLCEHAPVGDGTTCGEGFGTCKAGLCVAEFPCSEQGIRAAIATGGGPHTFACPGPTTVTTEAEIVIDNSVILDGEGELTVNGNGAHRVFSVNARISVELRGLTITGAGGRETVGAIWNGGTLTLSGVSVTGNDADLSGAIHNGGAARVTLSSCEVSANNGRGINNHGTLDLLDTSVSDNTGTREGGGILNGGTANLTNSTVSGNSGSSGGGIYNEKNGTLTLFSSTVSGNSSLTRGGGINNQGAMNMTESTVSWNTSDGAGGGIDNWGTMHARSSTVFRNVARWEGGGVNSRGTTSLTNSTISENTSGGTGGGAGLYNHSNATLTLTSCTVSDNNGKAISGDMAPTLRNTLIQGECTYYSVNSDGGNLESPGDTCRLEASTDVTGVSAPELNLATLQNNGGPTFTQLPRPGSAAIDVIESDDCAVATDQRGISRPQGPRCDVGAVEVEQ